MSVVLQDFSWKRMVAAVEAVHERACRATAALAQAGIPYAVAGGNAVAAWVSRVDRAAVRNTQDVDIVALDALVRMKLNSFRRKDQVHLLDLLDLGLIDSTWLPSLLPEHAARLQQLIDDPNG
ncbi:MAG: hypothetical protein ACKV2Q_01715 [Planctomycetaceae bacterium]